MDPTAPATSQTIHRSHREHPIGRELRVMGQADCKQETITAWGSTCVVVAYQVVHKSISLFVGRERLLSCKDREPLLGGTLP